MTSRNTTNVAKLLAIVVLVASMLFGMIATASNANASTSNTRADSAGTLELAGSDWLNGNGVGVYSNGNSASNTSGSSYVTGIFAGSKWQCVELVNRLYLSKGWISSTWYGNGNTIYANAPSNLSKEPNGSISYLNPGDVVTLNDGGDGHAGIVNSVSAGGTVQIVNQNTGAVYSSASLSNKTLTMAGWAGYAVQGVIHAPISHVGSAQRITYLDSSGSLYVKEGAINATWVLVAQGIIDFKASPNRIAALDSSGTLWVKEGPLNAVWSQVATGLSSGNFGITDNSVYALWGTNLYVKSGSLGAPWSLILNPVSDFKVSANNHIAARMTNGHLLVQWGPVGSGWTDVASGYSTYQITDDVVLALFGTDLYVKSAVGAPWALILNPVSDFRVSSGDHIAAKTTTGEVVVQWGPVGSGWTTVVNATDTFDISDSRVANVANGDASIKEGAVNAPWTLVTSGATKIALS